MEQVLGLTAVAVALLIGLGALGTSSTRNGTYAAGKNVYCCGSA